jgi:RHS repeat-associated protein
VKDNLGSTRAVVDEAGEVVEAYDYYPFGLQSRSYKEKGDPLTKETFTGKEQDTESNLHYFGARYYDAGAGRFSTIDPHSDLYFSISPYHYAGNNPLAYIDPTGADTVYFIDQNSRPNDDGKEESQTYTAAVVVVQNGVVLGIYSGSTYPNSKSSTDNTTKHNTLAEGSHPFNNKSGHKSGTKKGLNIVDDNGNRDNTPGNSPDGSEIVMEYVNVHSGHSDNKGPKSRGSKGCPTIAPEDADDFNNHFDWSEGTTGNSNGEVNINREPASAQQSIPNSIMNQIIEQTVTTSIQPIF